jgi:hypothetical protein
MITVLGGGVGGGRGSPRPLVRSLTTAPLMEGSEAATVAHIAG